MELEDFISCPDHLVASAMAYGEWLESRGYRVAVEPWDSAYPNTPHLVAKRLKATLVVEVMDTIEWSRLVEWAKYAKACETETRVQAALAKGISASAEDLERLRDLGVGLAVWGTSAVVEAVPPIDLAVQVDPPELPPTLMSQLGHAYDQLRNGEWREGFEEACLVLEQESRKYLRRNVGKRIQVLTPKGVPKNPTATQIDRYTLGELASTFGRIQSPNQTDSRIGDALRRLNTDRVSVVHFKNVSARREAQLRRRFGKNMMILVNTLKMLKGI